MSRCSTFYALGASEPDTRAHAPPIIPPIPPRKRGWGSAEPAGVLQRSAALPFCSASSPQSSAAPTRRRACLPKRSAAPPSRRACLRANSAAPTPRRASLPKRLAALPRHRAAFPHRLDPPGPRRARQFAPTRGSRCSLRIPRCDGPLRLAWWCWGGLWSSPWARSSRGCSTTRFAGAEAGSFGTAHYEKRKTPSIAVLVSLEKYPIVVCTTHSEPWVGSMTNGDEDLIVGE